MFELLDIVLDFGAAGSNKIAGRNVRTAGPPFYLGRAIIGAGGIVDAADVEQRIAQIVPGAVETGVKLARTGQVFNRRLEVARGFERFAEIVVAGR